MSQASLGSPRLADTDAPTPARAPRRPAPTSGRVTADLLAARLEPGDTAVDLGAGVGLVTIAMASRVAPAGRVLAVEADPANGPKLLANARWCGLDRQIDLRLGQPDTTPRLDDLLDEAATVDLIRIDESLVTADVVAGMEWTLRRCRPTLLIDRVPAEAWDVCAALERLGYTLRTGRGQVIDTSEPATVAHLLASHPHRSAA